VLFAISRPRSASFTNTVPTTRSLIGSTWRRPMNSARKPWKSDPGVFSPRCQTTIRSTTPLQCSLAPILMAGWTGRRSGRGITGNDSGDTWPTFNPDASLTCNVCIKAPVTLSGEGPTVCTVGATHRLGPAHYSAQTTCILYGMPCI
jgi:hypothetical protein